MNAAKDPADSDHAARPRRFYVGKLISFQGDGRIARALVRLNFGTVISVTGRCEDGVWRFFPEGREP